MAPNLCGGIAAAPAQPSSLHLQAPSGVAASRCFGTLRSRVPRDYRTPRAAVNPDTGARRQLLWSEVECELDCVPVACQRGAAGSVVTDVPAELPLRFVIEHEMAQPPRRVRDRELARAVVGELAHIVLERHPSEHDLQGMFAVKVDG